MQLEAVFLQEVNPSCAYFEYVLSFIFIIYKVYFDHASFLLMMCTLKRLSRKTNQFAIQGLRIESGGSSLEGPAI